MSKKIIIILVIRLMNRFLGQVDNLIKVNK